MPYHLSATILTPASIVEIPSNSSTVYGTDVTYAGHSAISTSRAVPAPTMRTRRDNVGLNVPVESQGIPSAIPPANSTSSATSSPPTARQILQRSKRGPNTGNRMDCLSPSAWVFLTDIFSEQQSQAQAQAQAQASMHHQYSARVQTGPATGTTSHIEPSLSPVWKPGFATTGRELSNSNTNTNTSNNTVNNTVNAHQLAAETRIYDPYPYDYDAPRLGSDLPCGFFLTGSDIFPLFSTISRFIFVFTE